MALAAACSAGSVWALPPQIELDRLLLAADTELQAGNITTASDYLERVEPLGIAVPPQYHWLKSLVLAEQQQWPAAREHVEKYLTNAGRDAPNYQAALKLLTRVEQAQGKVSAAQTGEAAIQVASDQSVKMLENQQAATYDRQVQSLYLGDDVTESLLTHLNGLLQAYRYLEGRVKNPERSDRVEYTLSVSEGSILVIAQREVRHTVSGPRSALNMSYLGVFGVDPMVKYRCSSAADNCTFRHPVDGTDWLRIAYNEAGAQEISLAMTRLLQALQRSAAP
jgi:hypothetical protein